MRGGRSGRRTEIRNRLPQSGAGFVRICRARIHPKGAEGNFASMLLRHAGMQRSSFRSERCSGKGWLKMNASSPRRFTGNFAGHRACARPEEEDMRHELPHVRYGFCYASFGPPFENFKRRSSPHQEAEVLPQPGRNVRPDVKAEDAMEGIPPKFCRPDYPRYRSKLRPGG